MVDSGNHYQSLGGKQALPMIFSWTRVSMLTWVLIESESAARNSIVSKEKSHNIITIHQVCAKGRELRVALVKT